jgi:hypothetical protein
VTPTTLKVFDFDWVLLRTPCRKGAVRWWEKIESLEPPYVPRMVPKGLWISPTIKEARAAVKDPETITAVITGRPNEHCLRVKKILHQMGIRPNFIMCRSFEWEATLEDVLSFKVEAINEILSRNPSIFQVEVWEDLEKQLRELQRYTTDLGLKFHAHLVTERHEAGISWHC